MLSFIRLIVCKDEAKLNEAVKKAERELKKPLIIKMKEEHQIDINSDDDFFDI